MAEYRLYPSSVPADTNVCNAAFEKQGRCGFHNGFIYTVKKTNSNSWNCTNGLFKY